MSKFVKPTPNKMVINSLTIANKFINLYGFPILRLIPFLNKIPGIKGFCRIGEINFSDKDRVTLRQYLNSDNAFFIVPNHPELYTDWMIDKYICGKYAPQTACWATHEIVNGMGPKMQKFWLNNNLVAAIPGSGNEEAKQYSIDSALKGEGVLLHPEGKVNWTSDYVQKVFPGCIEMAKKTAEKKKTYLIPIVWKLKFVKNVETKLHKEINYIEKYMLASSSQDKDLAQRLVIVHQTLFKFIAKHYHIEQEQLSLYQLLNILIHRAAMIIKLNDLSNELTFDSLEALWKMVKKASLQAQLDTGEKKQFKSISKTINSLFIFKLNCYTGELTQEHIAECLQRIRVEFINKGFRNVFHKFIPIPVGRRVALMKVCEPILISPEDSTEVQMSNLKNTLQNNLNNLIEKNKESFIYYPNNLSSIL
jgi:hypothetical protein